MVAPTVDAVLPVTLKDLPRARLLLRSMHARFHCLGTLWVVVPAHQVQSTREGLADVDLRLQIVAETDVVPELDRFGRMRGWFKQQLVKLAIADHVTSDFYLTLDADVLCTRHTQFDQLVTQNAQGVARAPVVLLPDTHPDWYRSSLQVLGLTARREGLLHNVTPALLARSGVQALMGFLNDKANNRDYNRGLRGLRQRAAMIRFALAPRAHEAPWRIWLCASTPWTEYALYYSFLEATDRYDLYHFDNDTALYSAEDSVWYADRKHFDRWDPKRLFEGDGPPYFVVVQSNTGIAPADVAKKVDPFFDTH